MAGVAPVFQGTLCLDLSTKRRAGVSMCLARSALQKAYFTTWVMLTDVAFRATSAEMGIPRQRRLQFKRRRCQTLLAQLQKFLFFLLLPLPPTSSTTRTRRTSLRTPDIAHLALSVMMMKTSRVSPPPTALQTTSADPTSKLVPRARIWYEYPIQRS